MNGCGRYTPKLAEILGAFVASILAGGPLMNSRGMSRSDESERWWSRIDQFESLLFEGKGPRIEDVPDAELADNPALLKELIHREIEYRGKRGDAFALTEYLDRFPLLAQDPQCVAHLQETYSKFVRQPATDVNPQFDPTVVPATSARREPSLAGRPLLFGIVALQNNFITREQLVAAFDAWVQDKSRDLGQILVATGELSEDEHDVLSRLVAKFMEKHGGDAERSLAALSSVPQVRPELERLADADLVASLGHLGQTVADQAGLQTVIYNHQDRTGRFRILRPHAQGGLGQVSVALDQELHREVALKEIRVQYSGDPTARERFVLEAEITGGLEHPGIVPVYALGQSVDGRPFYAMRFVKGDSLKQAIEDFHRADNPNRRDAGARQLALRQLLGRFSDVCNAMEYAHSRGVLHRDLKPGNIMVGKYGETLVVDWGLAKALGKREVTSDDATLRPSSVLSSSVQTQAGSAIGTPAYMSPEQAAGKLEGLGPATDVYSLGATLYHLLCGRPPFEKEDLGEILRKVQNGEFPRPRTVLSEIPPGLEAICLKAMAFRPENRYSSARALTDDVEHWLADEPISAAPESASKRLSRWGRKHRAWAMSGAAALALVTVVSTIAAVWINSARGKLVTSQQAEAKQLQIALHNETRATANEREAKLQQRRVERVLASTHAFEKGLQLCERGNSGEGVLWLTLSLELVPPDAQDLYQRIRENLERWQQPVHCLRQVFQHGGRVNAVAFSPDGKILATASEDGTSQLWDTGTGQKIGPSLQHQGPIVDVAFSPSGKTILTGSEDQTARVWETSTGKLTSSLAHRGAITVVAFSPDGTRMLTGSNDQSARLWDATTGLAIGQPLEHKGAILAIAFSRDSSLVATGSADYTARVWDSNTGKPVGSVLQHPNRVHAVAFRPDDKALLLAGGSGLGKGEAQWRDVETGNPIGDSIKDNQYIKFVASGGGDQILLTGASRTVRLRDAVSGSVFGEPIVHYGDLTGIVLNWDGGLLLTAGGDHGRVWDVNNGKPIGSPLYHRGRCRCIALSPNGKLIVTGGDDQTARLWELSPPSPRILKHQGWVTGAVFHPNGEAVLTATNEGVARLWNSQSGRLIRDMSLEKVDYHNANIWHIAMSPAGDRFATDSDRLQVWETATGKPIGSAHDVFPIHRTLFIDNRLVAVTVPDWNAKIATAWDFESNKALGPSFPYAPGASIGAFSQDRQKVLIGYNEGGARLWEVATGNLLMSFPHPQRVMAVAFSPDNRSILTGGADRTARFWEMATGKMIGEPLVCPFPVRSAAFSPDGRSFLLGGEDGTARLSDSATRRPIGLPFLHETRVEVVNFAPDGRSFVTGSFDETARIWKTPSSIEGSVERIALWIQTSTGLELGANDSLTVLDGPTWQERRQRLEKMDGTPLPP